MKIARITSIDVLRGFALLGILIMNIMSFSMPSVGYFSPVGYEGTWGNQVVYGISHIVADQKFMAIFSMLFGASTILYIESAQKKGKRAGLLFYVRNVWLLVIGSLHSTYLWFGDVLFVYAICSFLLYFFRNLSPKKQFIFGLIIYLIPSVNLLATHSFVVDELPAVEHTVFIEHWSPSEATLQKELDAFRGSYADQIRYREDMFQVDETQQSVGTGPAMFGLSILLDVFSRAFGMMLVGMACFRWGVFSNSLSEATYTKMAKYGLGIGIPLSLLGLVFNYSQGWTWKWAHFLGRIPNSIATPGMAFAYVALVMLFIQKGYAPAVQRRLSAVGKTALSAYLMQSLIGTFIFYGFGLGLFGHVSRIGQVGIMLGIWLVLLFAAPIWLTRFRFGPLEWIWRCLTYFKWMPVLKTKPSDTQ